MEQERFDADGFLPDPGNWNEELALCIAREEGWAN